LFLISLDPLREVLVAFANRGQRLRVRIVDDPLERGGVKRARSQSYILKFQSTANYQAEQDYADND
jgi:hypothetical protein